MSNKNNKNKNNKNQVLTYEPNKCEECLPRGSHSINPVLSSLNEIIIIYLKELSFYILKLKDFGITNDAIKEVFIYALTNIVTDAEYNQEQFDDIISKLYDYILYTKNLYEKNCLERNLEIKYVKSYFKYSKTIDLTKAIKKGEKYFLKRNSFLTPRQENLYEIVLFLGKSLTIKILELQSLGKDHDNAFYAILLLLNIIKPSKVFPEEEVKQKISEIIKIYYDIVRTVFYRQVELFGEIRPAEVSFSSVPGKAILVSGSDYKILEFVLEAVKNKDINVYTHGTEMLMARSFPKFQDNPNLKGHFGSNIESCLLDFATFPGSILISKRSLQKIEYLYRGRLFTLDPIPPQGVIKIKNHDFEPLIKSALEAKGFKKATKKPSIKVGFDEKELNKKIDYVLSKMFKKEIKHLYIIGIINYPNAHKQYFEKFFELLPKDCFAFSIDYNKNENNIFHLDSFYDYTVLYKILKRIKEKTSLDKIKISIFVTRCDKHIISNLINLKDFGIKNLYICKCPSNLVNPALIETLKETFEIKEFSDPQKDIQETLTK